MATDLFSWDIHDFLRPQTFQALSASKKQGLLSWPMGSLILVTVVFCMSYSFSIPVSSCSMYVCVCSPLHVHLLTFYTSCLVLWNSTVHPVQPSHTMCAYSTSLCSAHFSFFLAHCWVYVCACVCVCVGMTENNPVCLCSYVYVCTQMAENNPVCVYVCMYAYRWQRATLYVCSHVYACILMAENSTVCVLMNVCMHMDVREQPCMCVFICVCMCVDGRGQLCVCMFMCVCMRMDGRGLP